MELAVRAQVVEDWMSLFAVHINLFEQWKLGMILVEGQLGDFIAIAWLLVEAVAGEG